MNKPVPASPASSRDVVPVVIYVVGALLYAILCLPAIRQRGYPPLDPGWTAVTFLWPAPVLIAAVLNRPHSRDVTVMDLMLYCLFTGFINAASQSFVTPKRVNLIGAFVAAIIIFGPGHLLFSAVVLVLIKSVQFVLNRYVLTQRGAAILSGVACAGVIAGAFAFPFAYREHIFREQRSLAKAQAESDWDMQAPMIVVEGFPDSSSVQYDFDPATGLKCRRTYAPNIFTRTYNEAIHDLIRKKGIPEWSMKKFLVPDEKLIALLDSDVLPEIEKFPHKVNDNIILIRRGKVPGWSNQTSSNDDALRIASPISGVTSTGSKVEPAYVWKSADFPTVYFIRSGKSWIAAYHESGTRLSYVSRY